ncbi:hypothetical protein CRUP_014595 [Coryphaenoides rupestris]|nr:hypothetical protein CRUP_014595 [Coryphaenoides rupestris]
MEDPELIAAAILLPKFKTTWTERADIIEAGLVYVRQHLDQMAEAGVEQVGQHSSDEDDFFSSMKSSWSQVEAMRPGEEGATGITKSQQEKRDQPRGPQERTIDNQPQSSKSTKSALNDVFKEWQERVSQGKGNTGHVTDFRKFLKRPARPPPPTTPAPCKPAPPPPRLVKRKVEVDMLKLCWGESWKTLKPPRRGHCRSVSLLRSTLSPGRRSRGGAARSKEEEEETRRGWRASWKLVKPSPAPPKGAGEGLWEVVSEARFLGRYQAPVGGFSLPVMGGDLEDNDLRI